MAFQLAKAYSDVIETNKTVFIVWESQILVVEGDAFLVFSAFEVVDPYSIGT